MLAKARQILVSELALAEKTNEDKAEALLDEVLASLASGPAQDRCPTDSGAGASRRPPEPGLAARRRSASTCTR